MITQNDVRQIQLAKGPCTPRCRLLMDAFGIETVDRIRLAGAFGAHIDPVRAMVLGLVPDCDPEHVTSAGNAAGTGARIALLNRASREEIEAVVRLVEKLGPRWNHGSGARRTDGHPARHRSVPAVGRRRRSSATAHRLAGRPPRRRGRTSQPERSST